MSEPSMTMNITGTPPSLRSRLSSCLVPRRSRRSDLNKNKRLVLLEEKYHDVEGLQSCQHDGDDAHLAASFSDVENTGGAVGDDTGNEGKATTEVSSECSSNPGSLRSRLSQGIRRTRERVRNASQGLQSSDDTIEVSWQCMSVSAISDFWDDIKNNVVAPDLVLFCDEYTEDVFSMAHAGSKRVAGSDHDYELQMIGFDASASGGLATVEGFTPRIPGKCFTFPQCGIFDHARENWSIRDVIDHVLIPLENEFRAPVVDHFGDGLHDVSEGIFVLVDQTLQFDSLVKSLECLCKLRNLDPNGCYVWLEAFGVHHMITGLPLGKENDKSRAKWFYQYEMPYALKHFLSATVVLDDDLEGYQTDEILYSLSQIGASGLPVQAVWPTRDDEDPSVLSLCLQESRRLAYAYQHIENKMGLSLSEPFHYGSSVGKRLPFLIVSDTVGPTDRVVAEIKKNTQLVLSAMFFEFINNFAERQLAKMSTIVEAQDIQNAAKQYVAIGRYNEAFDLAERALEKLSKLPNEVSEAVKHTILAFLADLCQDVQVGRKEEALSYYEDAIAACSFERDGVILIKYTVAFLELSLRIKSRQTEAWNIVDMLFQRIQDVGTLDNVRRHRLSQEFLESSLRIVEAAREYDRLVRYCSIGIDVSIASEEETGHLDNLLQFVVSYYVRGMSEVSSDQFIVEQVKRLLAKRETTKAEERQREAVRALNISEAVGKHLLKSKRCANFVLELADKMPAEFGYSHQSWGTSRSLQIIEALLLLGRTKEAATGIKLLELEYNSSSASSRITQTKHTEVVQLKILHAQCAARKGRLEEALDYARAYVGDTWDANSFRQREAVEDSSLDRRTSENRIALLQLLLQSGSLEESYAQLDLFEQYVGRMHTSCTQDAPIDYSASLERDSCRMQATAASFRGMLAYLEGDLKGSLELYTQTRSLYAHILGPRNLESIDYSLMIVHTLIDLDMLEEAQELFESLPRPNIVDGPYYNRSIEATRKSLPTMKNRSKKKFQGDVNAKLNKRSEEEEEEEENGIVGQADANKIQSHQDETDIDKSAEIPVEAMQSEATGSLPILGMPSDQVPSVAAISTCEKSTPLPEYIDFDLQPPPSTNGLSKVGLDGQFALIEGRLSLCRGDLDRYVEIMRDIAEAQGIYSGLDSALYATASLKYVKALRITRRYAEALSLAEEVLSILRSIEGPDSLLLGDAVGESAILHARVGDVQEALALSAEAILLIRERIPDSVRMGYALFARGIAQAAAGHLADGESSVEHGIDIMMKCHGGESSSVAYGLHILAKMSDDADVAREAANIYTSCLGADHPFTQRAEQLLATLCK